MLYSRLALVALALTSAAAAPTAAAPENTMTAMSADELTAKIGKVTAAAIQKREDEKRAKEAEYDRIAERVVKKLALERMVKADAANTMIIDGKTYTCDGSIQFNGSGPPLCNGKPMDGSGGGGGSCFDKDSTTACLFESPGAETCSPALIADLVSGDLVLGRDGPTSIVAVQHKAIDTVAEMLTFHTADGSSVSMTPDHGVFVDGALVAADDAKVGSALSTGIVTKITKGEANIINAVTADGTIVADGVLAASNPMWIASLTVDAPIARAIANAVVFAVGDVDSVGAGCAKVAATLTGAFLAAKALRSRKASP